LADVYAALAEKLNYPPSSERFQQVLRKLATLDEVRLMLDLPAPLEDLAQKLSITPTEVESNLDSLYRRGMLLPSRRTGYRLPQNAGQLHGSTTTAADEFVDKELLDLWRDFRENESDVKRVDWLTRKGVPQWRVIPAWRALVASPGIAPGAILPHEDVRAILREVPAIAQIVCDCRRVIRACPVRSPEVCLQFERHAEYHIGRGSGVRLSVDEALERMEVAMDEGLVHIGLNVAAAPPSLCNCCNDCCDVILPLKRAGKLHEGLAQSRYQATVDRKTCDGCQVCVDRCLFDAISMSRATGSKRLKAQVDPEQCFGCGMCVIKCKPGALSLKAVRSPEHIPPPGQASWYSP